jgi:hypothetical protein
VRNLHPTETVASITLPFARGAVATMSFKPWLDAHDGAETLFVSTHGFGPRDPGETRPARMRGVPVRAKWRMG